MKFVKGKPFKGCEKCYWYLYIDDSFETYKFISNIISNRMGNIILNPHIKADDVSYYTLRNAVTKTQIDILMGERNSYYMNPNGGMCPNLYDIEDEIEAGYWPETERIKIIKWQGGSHYYAKVDGMDVTDDKGNQKWNTREYAKEVAEKFMIKLDQNLRVKIF